MTSTPLLSDEQRGRVALMLTDMLELISVEAALADGSPDEEAKARLLARREEGAGRIDMGLVLDIADQLGEEALRKAAEQYCPPAARMSMDALLKGEGGMLPLVRTRIARSDAFGCALGAAAVVGGVACGGVMGGCGAVLGIMLMAESC
ncbi:hypothetical protein [Streptomyces djakartensis]|uniref:Uncharacterized protein n=1 Tax=Streptomyces djakartensis TaxID=68193 RepID=A0ABQ2ZC42_9ACTN|nr:hypothetical protein [Streptomyces djakartensis]GGY07701.1 hypothetical protein GCM10010384_10260 [Streptomyces djakartensis]